MGVNIFFILFFLNKERIQAAKGVRGIKIYKENTKKCLSVCRHVMTFR